MYKIGDRVKTIQKIQPHTKEGPIAVEGTIRHISTGDVYVVLDAQTDEGTRQGWGLQRIFKLADLLAHDVLRLKVGDLVTTSATKSDGGNWLKPGDVYIVTASNYQDVLGVANENSAFYLPRASCTKASETAPKPKLLGWTFRSTKDTFDGARVLRELDAAGADYAVVIWGKGDTDRRAVVHTRFYTRLVMAGLAVGVSNPVWSVGPGTPTSVPAASVALNYHTVTRNGKPATLAQLKALVADLAKAEEKRKTLTTYVAYGKVDG